MKVLLVNSSKTMRGGENQTLELGTRLRARGIETAYAVSDGSALEAVLPGGAPVLGLRFESLPLRTPARLRRFIRNWEADIVHAHTSRAHLHALLACLGGPPLVVSRRTAFEPGSGRVSALKYGRGVAHYIPISEAAARSLRSRGVAEDRMTVVPSGVDTARFRHAVRDPGTVAMLGGREGTLLAGTAAAFEKEKGHGVLLDAAAMLRPKGAELRFVLLGEGSLKPALEKRAAREGLDVGFFSPGEGLKLEAFLKALDIYVLPSIEEGLSTGLMAAMAAGLPCVASRTGGIPEVTGGEAALLVEPGIPSDLAAAVAGLACDASERERLSALASRRAELFDVEGMVDGTLAVYRRVIAERGR